MKLREYQNKASDSILDEWKEVESTLLVLPTGVGKTVVFADVIRRMQPGRAMVLAHREELIWQARDKIKRVTGLECDIEMAENRATHDLFGRAPVVISTVQTQNSDAGMRKRMGAFKPEDFSVLIIDEAHHATAASYKNIINYYTQNPRLRVLGVTATPDRADEEALGQVFKTVAFDYEILDAIHDGWLVPVEQQMVSIAGLDFSAMRTTAGDLNGADLAAVMEAERNLLGVSAASLEIVKDRRAIVFTASVKQAEQLCDIFNRHKPGMSAWVCGATPKDERRQMLSQFAEGKVQVVCNCLDSQTQILTRRGWVGPSDIHSQDITATLNLQSNAIEWQPISRVVQRKRIDVERMVTIKNQTLDSRVTEGHRMVVRVSGAKNWKICDAAGLPLAVSPYEIPVSAIDMNLSGVPLSDEELEFLGLFATDGSLNIKRASIEICQAKCYAENCDEIDRILTACRFDYARSDGGAYWRYRIPKGNIGGTLRRRGWGRLGEWIDKHLAPELKNMTVHQFEKVLHGLWLGDGDKHYIRTHKRPHAGVRICGVDLGMFDRLQAWAVVRGWATNLSIRPNTSCGKHPNSILGHISFRKRTTVRTNNSHVSTSGGNPARFETDKTDEDVWCVTNENGTIITRRNGHVLIMGQCGVLTEGFDDAGVSVIVMARPTKSRSLYSQMVGRSTRPLPGIVDGEDMTPDLRKQAIAESAKPSCLVVDFVGNSGRHKLMTSADILGGKVSDKAIERAIERAKKLGQPVRMSEVLDDEERQLQIEAAKEKERLRRLTLVAKAKYSVRNVSPFDVLDIMPVKARGWDQSKTLTEKQRALLLKQGIDPSTLPYTQARQLIGAIFNRWEHKLATFKQCLLLRKHGVLAENLTMNDASAVIDMIAKNNWTCTNEIRAFAARQGMKGTNESSPQ